MEEPVIHRGSILLNELIATLCLANSYFINNIRRLAIAAFAVRY